MQNIDDFIESLLRDKGITNIPQDAKNELKAEMKDKLLAEIDRASIAALSEEKAEELSRLVDDPNFTKDDIAKFIENSGVDLTAVAVDTMLRFRNLYLGLKEEK